RCFPSSAPIRAAYKPHLEQDVDVLGPGVLKDALDATLLAVAALLDPAEWRHRAGQPGPPVDADAAGVEVRGHAVRHRSEEHTSELQSLTHLVCRLLPE